MSVGLQNRPFPVGKSMNSYMPDIDHDYHIDQNDLMNYQIMSMPCYTTFVTLTNHQKGYQLT